jgi:hypothetical protein
VDAIARAGRLPEQRDRDHGDATLGKSYKDKGISYKSK